MKTIIAFGVLTALILGCGSRGGYEKAENAQDAGREFIRASLDGDYARAKFYMLQDTTNAMLIEQQKRNYQQLKSNEKEERRKSSIRPITIVNVNDSVAVYKYFNTYNPADTTTMVIVRSKDEWLVDLKSILD
ncbi:MAG: DUF4878 domain-containing protein [Chitinophagaceae bacterium]|nr:DUF4878 domain-containing protein [Chitinophagaceae bacterium]